MSSQAACRRVQTFCSLNLASDIFLVSSESSRLIKKIKGLGKLRALKTAFVNGKQHIFVNKLGRKIIYLFAALVYQIWENFLPSQIRLMQRVSANL